MSSAGNAGPLVHSALVQVVANPKGECTACVLNAKPFCLQVWDRPWWAGPDMSQRFNSSLAPRIMIAWDLADEMQGNITQRMHESTPITPNALYA
jgi:hypothetical protein